MDPDTLRREIERVKAFLAYLEKELASAEAEAVDKK